MSIACTLPFPARLRVALALMLPAASAVAADTGTLTGDWGGHRAAWEAAGVDIAVGYTSEEARNLSGGARHASAHAGQLAVQGRLDLGRLWGLERTRAEVALTLRDGENLVDRAGLGVLVQNQEVFGRGNIPRLTRLWVAHASADGRWDIKAGRVGVGEDFAALDCTAMHLDFCGAQPAIFGGDYWYNWPISQWGGRAEFRPRPQVYARLGAYQVNPRYTATGGGGLRLAPSGTTGTLTPFELGWEPVIDGRAGQYAVGGWYSSAPRADVVQPAIAGTGAWTVMRGGTYGGWVQASQHLTSGNGSSERAGLHGQLAYAQGDRRSGEIDRMLSVLLTWQGPFARRPLDQIGLGLGNTWLNPRFARQRAQVPGVRLAASEQAAELFYGWQAMPGLRLQPNLQYVRQPGAVADAKSVVVLGLKSQLTF